MDYNKTVELLNSDIGVVKGIGEKTAIKLIQEYDTIENLYNHIDEIKGKLQFSQR